MIWRVSSIRMMSRKLQPFCLSCFLMLPLLKGSEIGVPERFLKPRNFNPHPYEDAALRNQNLQLQALQLQLPQNAAYALFHKKPALVDESTPVPYPIPPAILKQKTERYKTEAPAKYASVPKNYAFSYAVKDKNSGDDFSHSQAHNGLATKGEYRVKLPDGRVQIVSYTADNNGYRADVRYEGDPLSAEEKKPTKKPAFNFEKFQNFDKFQDSDFNFPSLKGFKPFKSFISQTTPPPQAHHTHESQMQTLNKVPDSSEEYTQVDNYLDYYENNYGTQAPDYQNSIEEHHQPEARTPEDPFQNGYRFPYHGSVSQVKYSEAAMGKGNVDHQVQNDIAVEDPSNPNQERAKQTVPIAVYPVYSVTQPNYDYDRQVYSQEYAQQNEKPQPHSRQQEQLQEQQLHQQHQQLHEQRLRQQEHQLHEEQLRQQEQQRFQEQLRHQEQQQFQEQQLRQEQLHQQQLHQQLHQQALHQQHHTEVTTPRIQNVNNAYHQPKYVVPVVEQPSAKPAYISTTTAPTNEYEYQTSPAAVYEQSAYTTAAPTTVYRQLPSEFTYRKISPDLKPVPEERVKIQPNSEPHEDTGSPDYIVPPAAKPASQVEYQEASGSQDVSIIKSVSATLSPGYSVDNAKRSYPVVSTGAYPVTSDNIKRSYSIVTEKSFLTESRKKIPLDIRRYSSDSTSNLREQEESNNDK